MLDLSDDIGVVSGIGPKYEIFLNRLNIYTVEDLLLHIPTRYEDRSNVKKISELIAGEKALVIGTVEKIDNIYTRNRKRLTKAAICDQTGSLDILWFNQFYIKRMLPIGTRVSLFGALNPKNKKPEFIAPDWEAIPFEENTSCETFLPIYPLTNKLSNKWLRNKITTVLYDTKIDSLLPKEILTTYGLDSKLKALKNIHQPKSLQNAKKARETLSFEELTFLHLKAIKLRDTWQKKVNGHKIHLSSKALEAFKTVLPYQLTEAQTHVINEILDDLDKNIPMNRLLQGDVGSGKTVVAAAMILACMNSGFNCIYLAPTQILANQHYKTLKGLLSTATKCEVTLHTSMTTRKVSSTDAPNLIIGTHAVFHRLDQFNNIGLIIIDEQHKFGVDQRSKIIEHYSDKLVPNLLTMTATPIPRSLALTFYGDLTLSVIDEMPKGRKEVKTTVITENQRDETYDWINEQINENKYQAFIVCPFIEKSFHEKFQFVKAAESEYEVVRKYFKGKKIGLLHGRLKNDEKDEVIKQFRQKKLDILVTTPVIEVGVDVPNANIIFIETAERFGLASLHQLRGRVGRGRKQAYCILMPSSKEKSSIERLKNMETFHDGGKLAELDLKKRGPGDIYGSSQHGFLNLRIADVTDFGLVSKTRNIANMLFGKLDEYPKLAKKLDEITLVEDN